MNRDIYYSEIQLRLNLFLLCVKQNTKMNLLHLNIHAENTFRDLLNLLYGWSLSNQNDSISNIEGTDLIDMGEKLIIQISSSATKKKINDTLTKNIIANYQKDNYRIKFMFIVDDASSLRKNNN